ncbi:MAG: hypothetical protein U1F43_01845 [Myxococcota bacterium]
MRMNLVCSALGLTALFTTPALAQAPTWQVDLAPDNIGYGRHYLYSALDADGNLFVTGSGRNIPADAEQWLWVEKLDADGHSLWSSEWVNPNGMVSPRGIVVDGQGDAYVVTTAASAVFRTTCCDASGGQYQDNVEEQVTVKLAGASGAVAWTRSFAKATSTGVAPFDIMLDSLGRIVTSGSYSEPYVVTKVYRQVLTSAGNVAWSALEAEANYEGPCAAGANGALVCVSSGSPLNDLNRNVKVYKYTKTGALSWSKVIDDQALPNVAADVAIDGAGNVLVTGYNMAAGNVRPVVNMRLKGNSGALMWLQRVALNKAVLNSGTTAPEDYQELVPTTQGDFVVITGDSYPSPSGGNLIDNVLMRIDTATGNVEWTARRSGWAFAKEVDGQGNPVVTSAGALGNQLRSFDAATGALRSEIALTTGFSETLAIDPVSERSYVSGTTTNPLDYSRTGHTAVYE